MGPYGPETPSMPVLLNEVSSIGSRQIADRDGIGSRVYTAVLARLQEFPLNLPVWVERRRAGSSERETFVAYPVLQKGRVLRLHRRDGECFPGIVLERIGALEGWAQPLVTGGEGWFIAADARAAFYTRAFNLYDELPDVRGRLHGAVCWAGSRLLIGGTGEVLATADGLAWDHYPMEGAAEIWALAWDGLRIWVASEGGTFTIDPAMGVTTLIDEAVSVGLAAAFGGPYVHRATMLPDGRYRITEHDGRPLRDLSCALQGLRHNWAVSGGGHYVTDQEGSVHRFDAAGEQPVGGQSADGRTAEAGQYTFAVREAVFTVAYGKLARVEADRLVPVYDFGRDVRAYPCRQGFIIVCGDGLLFRVRRI